MNSTSLHKPLLAVTAVTGSLLLIPLVAMQLTEEVAWGPTDFVAAAALLFGAGMAMVMAVRHVRGAGPRAAVVAGIAICLAIVWAELAVGLFN